MEYLKSLWYNIEENKETSILDWRITHEWKTVHIELKSRRCKHSDYDDTMIWENKLINAKEKFEKNWDETLFFFSYTDWLYYINPIQNEPDRLETRMGRYDRLGFDKPKPWIFYNVDRLKKIY